MQSAGRVLFTEGPLPPPGPTFSPTFHFGGPLETHSDLAALPQGSLRKLPQTNLPCPSPAHTSAMAPQYPQEKVLTPHLTCPPHLMLLMPLLSWLQPHDRLWSGSHPCLARPLPILGTSVRNPFPQHQGLAFLFELKSHSSRVVFSDAPSPAPSTVPALWDALPGGSDRKESACDAGDSV